MSKFFSSPPSMPAPAPAPAPPPPPPPPPPPAITAVSSEDREQAKRRKIAGARNQSGRVATALSDVAAGEKLGA